MSKKNHPPAPIPPGNRSSENPTGDQELPAEPINGKDGTGFQEEDPKRRLGDFTGTGEHARQQPGGKNGANH